MSRREWILASVAALAGLAFGAGVSYGVVPAARTTTVTVRAQGALPPSTVAGAPGVVAIDPNAEAAAADRGGARPAGLANASSCGSERADVKHLTDGWPLPAAATMMTVDQLVAMAAPPVTQSSPRLPEEQTLVRLEGVHVVAAKQEADSDLHVILVTATGAEMNVEAPQAVCDSASPYAAQLAQARAALDAALGPVSTSTYTPEDLTATVEGVLFFDVLHGQRGAPNGVELHPVTLFQVGAPAPPTTTATTTTTGPGTTTTP